MPIRLRPLGTLGFETWNQRAWIIGPIWGWAQWAQGLVPIGLMALGPVLSGLGAHWVRSIGPFRHWAQWALVLGPIGLTGLG